MVLSGVYIYIYIYVCVCVCMTKERTKTSCVVDGRGLNNAISGGISRAQLLFLRLVCLYVCMCVVVGMYHYARGYRVDRSAQDWVLDQKVLTEHVGGLKQNIYMYIYKRNLDKCLLLMAAASKEAGCGRVVWRRWYSRQSALMPGRGVPGRGEPDGLEAKV